MTLKDKKTEQSKKMERKPQESSSITPSNTTRLTVKYDCGFSNQIYIRGKGASLSWEKGLLLKNVKADEWIFEINEPFSSIEFKFLVNDREYEIGENRRLNQPGNFLYRPMF